MIEKIGKNGQANIQKTFKSKPAKSPKKNVVLAVEEKEVLHLKIETENELIVAESEKDEKQATHINIENLAEIEANKHIFNEYFNIDYAQNLAKAVITPIEKYYFRARFIGFDEDHLPERNQPNRPLIFASNHSGMAFPWDGVIFASGLMRRNNWDLSKSCRGLSSPMLSQSKLMNPFLIKNFWKRAGGIDATSLNFDTLMHYNEANILIYPEGIYGIGKGFDKKYQLQRLSTSTLRMSLKYKTDIIPFATVNAEYINPFSYSIDFIDDAVRKIGVPFLPLGLTTLLVLLQPWMFYFGFPAKLTFVRGRRIKTYELLDKPFEEITREDLDYLRDRIHNLMQGELDMAVKEYGQKPYDLQEFFFTLIQNIRKAPFYLPVFWPLLFLNFERKAQELQAKLIQYKTDSEEDKQKRKLLLEENAEAKEDDLYSLIKEAATTIYKSPEILFLYTPVIGLAGMLFQGLKK